MRVRESFIESKVCGFARACGWLVHPKAAAGNRGWPDRTFSKPGRTVFVEFKAPGRKPTKLQLHRQDELRAKGYEVHVVDNIEDARAIFA